MERFNLPDPVMDKHIKAIFAFAEVKVHNFESSQL